MENVNLTYSSKCTSNQLPSNINVNTNKVENNRENVVDSGNFVKKNKS